MDEETQLQTEAALGSILHELAHVSTLPRAVYLRGSGAGLNSGAESVVWDLLEAAHAVEQADRNRVLHPDEPARSRQVLRAQRRLSCTRKRKTPVSAIHHVYCEMSIASISFDRSSRRRAITWSDWADTGLLIRIGL